MRVQDCTIQFHPIVMSRVTCTYVVKIKTKLLYFWCEHVLLFSCADKINCSEGSQLYRMSREQFRDVCGVSDGIRLFSQLQKDKPKVIIMCRFTVEHCICIHETSELFLCLPKCLEFYSV